MIGYPDAAALESFARRMAPLVRAGDVISLSGELGAGKTTFARGLLRGLGLASEAPSPTFTLVQTYDPPAVWLPVWHVDLYRLSGPEEARTLALDEADDALLLIEWPERLGGMFSGHALQLRLDFASSGGRGLTAAVPPGWEGRWPPPQ
ncbi:MAG: tRNA (adenosine(37)-N6)-threonylcarbamoyltransferase complex ATPase subunit type 1 TsaE [Sphingomonadaceae bacterium]|nr:tRNA (adenosine(37)-N6)-threonylcarbamoyltransferase complex ATPase subunit type 1 TsaE [Sphingomonadaceae bacterium]